MPRPPSRKRPLRTALRKSLEGARRLAVLAVGSDLRADDAAALLAAKHLAKLPCPRRLKRRIFLGGTAPENLCGPIKAFQPTHLVVMDSADMGVRPGQIAVLDPRQPLGGVSFCTHSLPLTVLVRDLLNFMACEVVIVGIQPKTLQFDKPPCAAVRRAALRLAAAIQCAADGTASGGARRSP